MCADNIRQKVPHGLLILEVSNWFTVIISAVHNIEVSWLERYIGTISLKLKSNFLLFVNNAAHRLWNVTWTICNVFEVLIKWYFQIHF